MNSDDENIENRTKTDNQQNNPDATETIIYEDTSSRQSKKISFFTKIIRTIRYSLLVRRNRILPNIVMVLFVIGLIILIWWWFFGQNYQTTEDAYVDGNAVFVTSQIPGTIDEIKADATDMVTEGQVLVVLNPVDAQLALEKAKTNLAQTVRSVRTQFATKDQLQANLAQKLAELTQVQAQYLRRKELEKTGALAEEEVQNAYQNLKSAQAAVHVAQKQLKGGEALVDHTSLDTHPNILNASAQLREAYINVRRTKILAPVSGMLSKRSTQIGQHVNVGTTLMSVIPLDHLWVNANFKESQLKNIRVGQKATLTADMYGKNIRYTGKVLGVDAGTGSAFALLPAQNATGNWIKVVQRVPVRIELDQKEVTRNPLRIGLSMKVTIDTKENKGNLPINSATLKLQQYKTHIFKDELDRADQLINQIIQENIGK